MDGEDNNENHDANVGCRGFGGVLIFSEWMGLRVVSKNDLDGVIYQMKACSMCWCRVLDLSNGGAETTS